MRYLRGYALYNTPGPLIFVQIKSDCPDVNSKFELTQRIQIQTNESQSHKFFTKITLDFIVSIAFFF